MSSEQNVFTLWRVHARCMCPYCGYVCYFNQAAMSTMHVRIADKPDRAVRCEHLVEWERERSDGGQYGFRFEKSGSDPP